MADRIFHFFSTTSGWIEFNRTRDGGETLAYQMQTQPLGDIFGVDFIDANTGWIAGTNGRIAKTTDSGWNWTIQEKGNAARLLDVFALDDRRA